MEEKPVVEKPVVEKPVEEKPVEERRNSGLNVALFLVAMASFAAAIIGLLTRPEAGWPRGAFALGMVLNIIGLLFRRRASR